MCEDIKGREYDSLRNELLQNKRYIFERPLLIMTAASVAFSQLASNPSIVWAGAGIYEDPDLYVFVSRNYGETFERVNRYGETEMGYLTAIATHPADSATAFLLFSIDHKPKILRTTDLGETWEDISGFGTDSTSNNGFPDVIVYSLMVFPYDTDIIWAGTEIGIFESTDNGTSWHYADNGLPAVSVWQMYIQDQNIVIATHGRGIWTASQWPGGIDDSQLDTKFKFQTYPNPSEGKITLEYESDIYAPLRIKVYDLKGRLYYTYNDVKVENHYSCYINLTSIEKGIYLITLEISDKNYTSRIVIN